MISRWKQSSDSKEWFYVDEQGNNKYGWIQDDNNWYFETPLLAMQKGWMYDRNDSTYYHFNDNGIMDNQTKYFEYTIGSIHDAYIMFDEKWNDQVVFFGEYKVGNKHYLVFYPSKVSQEDFLKGNFEYFYIYDCDTYNLSWYPVKTYYVQ